MQDTAGDLKLSGWSDSTFHNVLMSANNLLYSVGHSYSALRMYDAFP